ncbi:hypothetical protein P154DRAFT_621918 [Amniculicola lignicola CBS 123094]|uniref:Uncharacterized protein n=1 Tax=Amniculicola lignicola CBS 123094 TaxID=1392246 RepID=A0A6A5WG47_9PLEO|nr:hypothetical protein P154DRAFT_621918 [Amniculicola lignicola CBS 123094]
MANDATQPGPRGLGSRIRSIFKRRHRSTTVSTNAPSHSPSPHQSQDRGSQQALWDTAYEEVKIKDPLLIEEYEKTLSKTLTISGCHEASTKQPTSELPPQNSIISNIPNERREQTTRILENGWVELTHNKTGIRENAAQMVRAIETMRGIITEAVRVSPEASVVWAGVSFLVPFVINTHSQNETLRLAFEYVLCRAPYYAGLEKDILSNPDLKLSKNRKQDIESKFVAVYSTVIEFQARAIRRLQQSAGQVILRDSIKWEHWEEQMKTLQEVDEQLHTVIGFHNSSKLTELTNQLATHSEEMSRELKEARRCLQTLVSVNEETRDIALKQLEATQHHRDIGQTTLDMLGASQVREISETEKQCRELFRIDNERPHYKFYKSRVKERIPGTCKWLTENQTFRAWLNKDSGPLLITADPGCGKSVLSKYLVDNILPERQAGGTICYFFFKDEIQQTLRQALCALLHQLFWNNPKLIHHAMPYYIKKPGIQDSITSVNVALDILETIAQDQTTGPIILVIDALDECIKDDRERLIDFANDLFSGSNIAKLKMRFTSRPYHHIVSRLKSPFSDPDFHVLGEDLVDTLKEEIDAVISHRVKELRLEEDLSDYLISRLCHFENRTYLWISFVFESTTFRRTRSGIDTWLQQLPQSVEDYYTKILGQVEDLELVYKVICFLLVAQWPLTVSEMNEAVNIKREDNVIELETVDDFRIRLRHGCGLFISIHEDLVVFIHQTAREYLLQDTIVHAPGRRIGEQPGRHDHDHDATLNEILKSPSHWCHEITVHQAHAVVADCCLSFLTMKCVLSEAERVRKEWAQGIGGQTDWNSIYFTEDKNWDEDPTETSWSEKCHIPSFNQPWRRYINGNLICPPEEIPDFHITGSLEKRFQFFKYASQSWKNHVLESGMDYLQMDLRIRLLCHSTVSSPCLWRLFDKRRMSSFGHVLPFENYWLHETFPVHHSTLNSLASLGFLHAICQSLSQLDQALEREQATGLSRNRLCHRVYRELHGVYWDKKQSLFRPTGITPLWVSAAQGFFDIVKELLDRDTDVNVHCSGMGTTPLHMACLGGHDKIVQILVDKGALVDEQDGGGRMPLEYAIWGAKQSKSHGPINILAKMPLLVNRAVNPTGARPLHISASYNLLEVTEFLISNGADPYIKNNGGHTPLVDSGRMSVSLPFITFLSGYCSSGRPPLYEIPDDNGDTYLHILSRSFSQQVLQAVLSIGAPADIRGQHARTPLHIACLQYYVFTGMVETLLEYHANPNTQDEYGLTPLTYAVLRGSARRTELLIEAGACTDSGDYSGNNLECAAFLPNDGKKIHRRRDMFPKGIYCEHKTLVSKSTDEFKDLVPSSPDSILRALNANITQEEIDMFEEKATEQMEFWMGLRRAHFSEMFEHEEGENENEKEQEEKNDEEDDKDEQEEDGEDDSEDSD